MDKLQMQFDSEGNHLYKVACDRYLVEHDGDDPLLLGPADAKKWAEEHWPDRVVLIDGLVQDEELGEGCEMLQFEPSSDMRWE